MSDTPVTQGGSTILQLSCNDVDHTAKWEAHENQIVVPVSSLVRDRALRYGPLVQLKFDLHAVDETGSAIPHGPQGAVVTWEGRSSPHYLGPLGGSAVDTALFFPADELFPAAFTISVILFGDRCTTAPDPSECLLADHIRTILVNDECLGSLTSNAVQNKVIGLPFYRRAMNSYGRTSPFTKFVKRFDKVYGYWKVFRYLPSDAQQFIVPPQDISCPRLTTNALFQSKMYLENDVAREHLRRRATMEIRQLYDQLCHNQLPNDVLLSMIGETRSYKTVREVQFHKMLQRFAEVDDYGVVFHPLHSVCVIDGVRTDKRFALFEPLVPDVKA